jgi:hypothetical protein
LDSFATIYPNSESDKRARYVMQRICPIEVSV